MPIHDDIHAYNAGQTTPDRETCEQLARTIEMALPGAESKVWHRHPVWFLEGNPIVGYSKQKRGVALLFWSGQSFDEPGLTPNGKFKAAEARYLSAKEIDAAPLARWLEQARTTQWDYQNLVKNKGKLQRLR
jgi:hypothetical protein